MHPALRWTIRIVGGVISTLLLFLLIAYIWTEIKFSQTYEIEGEELALSSDSATLAEGRYLATAIGKCVDCHGGDFGGEVMIDDGAFATITVPNLTPGKGSVVTDYSVADWERSIRHGVGRDGGAIAIMPSNDYYWMTDRETGALISYMKSLPAVDREVGETTYGPVGRVLYLLGELPIFKVEKIDESIDRGPDPTPGITKVYGAHLARIGGCHGCHGDDLAGGHIPGTPSEFLPASNITPHKDGLAGYNLAKFTGALRLGKAKDGHILDPEQMPWSTTALMTDRDMEALWLYVSSVEGKGNSW